MTAGTDQTFTTLGIVPASTAAPTASGTPAAGSTLTCSPGTWSGTPPPTLAYAWSRDGTVIAGMTGSDYQVQAADVGHTLACTVTATNPAGTTSATSTALTIAPPASTAAPTAGGTPALGRTVTCSPGNWSGTPAPALTYQWLRDGTPIAGATTPTYVTQAADQGHALTCTVTATNSSGHATATSNGLTVPVATTPRIIGLTLSPRAFALGSKTPIVAAAKTPVETKIRFSPSETAAVTPTSERALPGRLVGKTCRPDSAKLRRHKPCTRYAHAGTYKFTDQAGPCTVRFEGVLPKRSKFTPGRYAQAQPCSLSSAVNNAAANDEIVVLPGSYAPTAQLNLSFRTLNIHGTLGSPDAATIDTDGIPHGDAVELGSGGRIADLAFVSTANNNQNQNILSCLNPNCTIERVRITTVHSYAIVFSGGTGIVRDSVIAINGNAKGIWASGAPDVQVFNETIVATAGSSYGILAQGQPSGLGIANVRNSIVRGKCVGPCGHQQRHECIAQRRLLKLRVNLHPGRRNHLSWRSQPGRQCADIQRRRCGRLS